MSASIPRDFVDRRCRVLFVAHDALLYGAQHSLLEIIGRIDRSRYEPLVVVPSSGPFTDALLELGVPFIRGLVQRWIFFPKPMTVHAILRRPWRRLNHPYILALLSWASLPFRLFLLTLLVRRKKIGLIYTNTATVLDGALVARICKIPHVWHLREPVAGNPDLSSLLPVNWVPSFTLRWSATVITNSHALARSMFGDSPPEKVKIVHNGVDLSRLMNAEPTSDLPHIPAGARLTAICGALQERKDVLTYIRTAARLRNSHPNLHHLVIGQGHKDYRQLIEKEIAMHGLSNRVHFLGYRNDIPALFSRIDVLISAAIHEPFGRTLIEAMAAGKPVISTRSGGPEEIIVNNKTGFLVDVGDDASMAAKLAEILNNHELQISMGEAARQRATALFDLQQVVKHLEAIFDGARKQHAKHLH